MDTCDTCGSTDLSWRGDCYDCAAHEADCACDECEIARLDMAAERAWEAREGR